MNFRSADPRARVALLAVALLPAGLACGDGSANDESDASSETQGESSSSSEAESGDGDGESESTGDGDGDGDGDGPRPSALPTPTGTCPDFIDGTVSFDPAGVEPRDVRIWISNAAGELDGPLVFYWHAYTSQPEEAAYGLQQAAIDDILARGGMVVAPASDPNSGQFPWYQIGGTGLEYDQLLADEILACAIEQVGVDTRHIHSVGMSAGGLQTSQFSTRRSNYVASAATYSGGVFFNAPYQDPNNKFPAMIIHGGDSDVFGGQVEFKQTSENWFNQLTNNGNFAFMCDHGGGHTIPPNTGDDIWQFFLDHPYGTVDSPYAGGLPSSFPSWCSL